MHFIVFRLDGRRYALPLTAVDRVVRAVDVTPLPNGPALVLGAINVHGQVVPVLNLRRRLRMPEREITADDWFLLAHTGRQRIALVVDESDGVVERSKEDVVASIDIARGLGPFPAVMRLDDELILIQDLDSFLSDDEMDDLGDALEQAPDAQP